MEEKIEELIKNKVIEFKGDMFELMDIREELDKRGLHPTMFDLSNGNLRIDRTVHIIE